MLADLGQIYLLLALVVSVGAAIIAVLGARTGSLRMRTIGCNFTLLIAALYTLAIGVMIHAFITKDFSLKIVSAHASSELSSIYSFTALYADKSGSIFFWGWLLSLLTAVIALQKHRQHPRITPYAIAVMAIIQAFFISLVSIVANVFAENAVTPVEGMGLNPQLQNIGMLIHPPLLYLGFAGFMVVFAFVTGALIARSSSAEWTVGIRRWTLFSWCILGLGNLVGAWWAYIELGWGGYWAWDPVENAGLMPWLLGTAFVHSIAMLRRRQSLQIWSLVLIVFTFSFVLLSPFITHGGIESILHGFADSGMPPYFLGAIIVSLIGSLALLIIRRNELETGSVPSKLISMRGAFLFTNMVIVLIILLMISGTVFPRISEAFGDRVSLERDFFDLSCGPVLLFLVFFIGICPLLSWKKSSWKSIGKKGAFPFGAASLAALIVLIGGIGSWYAVAAFVCGMGIFTILMEWFLQTIKIHRSRGHNYLIAFFALIGSNRPRYGGFIVHIGIILITLGVIGSSMYDLACTQALQEGDTVKIEGYKLILNEISIEHEEERVRMVASIGVICGNDRVATMKPERSYWFFRGESYSEVAIRTTVSEDLFVSLLSYDAETGKAIIRAVVNPLVVWMWVGGGVILLGGIIAFWPERRKVD